MRFEGDSIPVEKLPKPAGWRILVGKSKVESTSSGGIILAPQTVEEKGYVGYVAKVLAMGDACYYHPRFQGDISLAVRKPKPWVKVGDIIVIGQYSGQTISCTDGSGRHALKLINDDEVLAIVQDIDSINADRG